MKKILTLTFATLAIMCSCTKNQNPLEKTLKDVVRSGRILYGHQDDLLYGHDWNSTREGDHSFERSDVKSVCGDFPAVLGIELGGIELGDSLSLDGNSFELVREAALAHYSRGGIVTASWHPRNPVTGDSAWDVSDKNVVSQILPGAPLNGIFMDWLGRVCDFLESLKTPEGETIPIIWRPWHEHSMSWFWWGADLCTPDQYNELWRVTYDYFVNVRHLDNLLWAISPNGNDHFAQWVERYPGDEYVDIVGLDMYFPTWTNVEEATNIFMTGTHMFLDELDAFAKKHGKILAMTETGFEGLGHETWWTEILLPTIRDFPVAYVLTWRNSSDAHNRDTHFFGPFPGGPAEQDFRDFAANDKIMMLNDLK